MIKLYLIGISILLIAIVANAIIGKLGLMSWYDFIESLQIEGREALLKVDLIDYLWLFVGYPLTLGLGYLIGLKLYEFIF